jgi:hypothetical protein
VKRAMKRASFTVRATQGQSVNWKRAAELDGYVSVGRWLAVAADAYLETRSRAGRPLPLCWRHGRFRVLLEGDREVTISGHVSEPFGGFRGSLEGPGRYAEQYTLVHLPTRRVIASLKTYRQCRALASELAPILIRDDHAMASAVVGRHVTEQA